MENKINKKGLATWLIWTIGGFFVLILIAVAIYQFSSNNITGKVIAGDVIAVPIPVIDVAEVPQVIFIGVTTIPIDLAKNQGVINNIIITFSEAMIPTTVNSNTFIVKGPNNEIINGVITSDATKKIWTFNPTNRLLFNSLYNVRVTTEAKGVSGNSLIKDFLWSFTTSYGASSGGSGGSSSSSTPTITPVLTTITLSPSSKTLLINSTQQMTATSFDQNNASIVALINYTTSNSSVAIVNASGFVTALSLGNATITAANGIINDTSLINVETSVSCSTVAPLMGTASDFVLLSGTGISTTGTTSIIGDIGTGPAVTDTAITGFGLIADPSNQWSTSSLITGKVYAYNFAVPTPAKMNTAINDLGTAFTTMNAFAPCVTELGAGNIGGMTLTQGVYKWGTGVTIPTDLTLSGNATDIWVFQIAQTLDLASATNVNLIGGALAKNVYWVVTEVTTLGTTSTLNGNIISGPGTSTIQLQNGAVLNGRALSQTDITLIANNITLAV